MQSITATWLYLNKMTCRAILIEVCFVDSQADADIYNEPSWTYAMRVADIPGRRRRYRRRDATARAIRSAVRSRRRKCSTFGGPDDDGVAADEPLAFIQEVEQAPHLFLPYQPPDTTGLARWLNPHVHYVACRWNYDITPRVMLLEEVALVRAPSTGIALTAFPADWGPNANTSRIADLPPGLDAGPRDRD